jgi:hypothetical protein
MFSLNNKGVIEIEFDAKKAGINGWQIVCLICSFHSLSNMVIA